MMPPPVLDQPLQPKILKFLETLKRKNKKSASLVETFAGKPSKTLLDLDDEALRGDLEGMAEDIVTILQRHADDQRRRVQSQLMAEGEEPIYLPCRPTVQASSLAPKYNRTNPMDDEHEAEILGPGESLPDDGFAGVGGGTPRLADQAAAFAMDALGHNRAMFRLTMASAIRREHDDRRRILQLEGQVARYQEVIDKAVLVREQLLDRQAERTLEIDRVKQRDQWMQDGFAKIFGLVALHAPSILPKFGIEIDPRAREVLFDIVGSVAAAKPYVTAMRMASTLGATPPPPLPAKKADTATTAGAVAATTVVGGGAAAAASTLAAYASVAVRFISGVKDKLTMVRGMLPAEQVELMDQLLQLTETHGAAFQAVGQAVLQGSAQVTAPTDGATPPVGSVSDEDKKLARFIDLCSDFWTFVRPEDDDKMRSFLPAQAKAVLDEVRRDYQFSKAVPS